MSWKDKLLTSSMENSSYPLKVSYRQSPRLLLCVIRSALWRIEKQWPTLDHPTLISCYSHNRAYPTGCNCRNSFMHGAVWTGWGQRIVLDIAFAWSRSSLGRLHGLPSIFPCSVSTRTQSNPQRAMVLAWLLPGSICHAPNVSPEPVRKALWSRLAACIMRNIWTNRMYECSLGMMATFGKQLVFEL